MNPSVAAVQAIVEMMSLGAAKHASESWFTEPQDNHLDKAVRHIMTFKLIRDGNSPPDGEMHLKNAITRLAMALTQELEHGTEA